MCALEKGVCASEKDVFVCEKSDFALETRLLGLRWSRAAVFFLHSLALERGVERGGEALAPDAQVRAQHLERLAADSRLHTRITTMNELTSVSNTDLQSVLSVSAFVDFYSEVRVLLLLAQQTPPRGHLEAVRAQRLVA